MAKSKFANIGQKVLANQKELDWKKTYQIGTILDIGHTPYIYKNDFYIYEITQGRNSLHCSISLNHSMTCVDDELKF